MAASEAFAPDAQGTPHPESRAEKVRMIFERFDVNGDGGLDRGEMAALVVAANPHVKFKEHQISALLDRVFGTFAEFVLPGRRGLSLPGLLRIYDEGLGDVDIDFLVLFLPAVDSDASSPDIAPGGTAVAPSLLGAGGAALSGSSRDALTAPAFAPDAQGGPEMSLSASETSARRGSRAEKVRMIFERFDVNRDGGLDRDEMAALIVATNPRITIDEDEISDAVDYIFITYDEFELPGRRGLSLPGLLRAYDEGYGDVDSDFLVLSLPAVDSDASSPDIAPRGAAASPSLLDNHTEPLGAGGAAPLATPAWAASPNHGIPFSGDLNCKLGDTEKQRDGQRWTPRRLRRRRRLWTPSTPAIFPGVSRHVSKDLVKNLGTEPIELTFQRLQDMTDDFSERRKLGQGAYGKVYRGQDKNGQEVAVKLLHNVGPGHHEESFKNEFLNLQKLNHPYIVKLKGYCYETKHRPTEYNGRIIWAEYTCRALCLEYLHNGSLQNFLSGGICDGRLDWHTRFKIIKGAWEGLKYLHDESIYHLDLKPDNILLDINMVPKLADFGLSKMIFGGEEQTRTTQSCAGTPGYMPPEYIEKNVISKMFDIYSMGVVMIKIISGKNGRSISAEMSAQEFINKVHVSWRENLKKKWSGSSLEAYCQQVTGCTEIALKCVEVERHNRPSITDIVRKLTDLGNSC